MGVLASLLLAGTLSVPGHLRAQNAGYPQPPQDQQGPAYPQGGQPYPAPANGQYPPPAQYPPQAQYPPPQGQYGPPQQNYPTAYQPPLLAPQQLDNMVASIALYPDPLLAQVLTASTFYNQLPQAAGWANQHSYLPPAQLAGAIQQDNLPWDPSVLALLPFASVLNQLANNMGWTQALGNAVLAQRADVMDAVQRMRQEAYNYGYLRSNNYIRVTPVGPGQIEIVPVTPDFYYVPYYNPVVVFARPRPGLFVGGAIRFGPGIIIGANFAPFGWAGAGFGWREHTILIDHRPWARGWNNRAVYAHPYDDRRRVEGPRAEHHELRGPDHYEHREHDHH